MLTENERALVKAARATLQRAHRSDDHSVAAAAADSAGAVFTGMNVFHFTGGPCAEPVVIGQAVASSRIQLPLTTMVAVSDRGVIPPCGRCRQIMIDLYPEIRVLVSGPDELMSVPIRELLPYAYEYGEIEY